MIEAHGSREIVVRMVDGENLLERLLAVKVDSAVVIGGIGMVRDATLAYWNGTEYEEHAVPEPAELLSLQGNIGSLNGEPVAHCHATVARRDGTVTGGHLMAATVANTAEIVLGKLDGIVLDRRVEVNGLAGLQPST
jgi:predicted DNA-binding protein with PD1-like motif